MADSSMVIKLFLCLGLATAIAAQNCPSGWLEFSGNCYLLTDQDTQETTWHEAYATCLAEGADLASINSQEEQDLIEQTAEQEGFTDAFWVGLNKFGDYTAELEWTDGSDVSYTNWADDQPNNDNLELCSYTLAVPNENCFEREQNVNVVKGLMYYPWDEDRPNTFSFGYEWIYDYPQWCEDECAREPNCHAWTYFTPYYYWDYQWQSYCVGRSDFSNVAVSEPDTYAGFKQSCGEVGLWYTGNCGLRKGYLCKKPVGSSDGPKTVPPTQPITGYCPEGWLDAGNKCFLIEVEDNVNGHSWEEAVDYCRALTVPGLRDVDIVSIANIDEQDLLTSNIQKRSFGFWIGFHKLDDWAWTENIKVNFTNWAPGEPNGGGTDVCGELWIRPGPSGTWNDLLCGDLRGVICQGYKDGSISEPAPTTPHSCPEGYTPYWYSCYKLVQTAGTWVAGEQACSADGGHLVSIHSEPENAFVRSLARVKSALPVWIGWRQGGDNDFRWTDGWPNDLYSRWSEDEPSEDGEGCVAMDAQGEWYNGLCSATQSYVCKTTDQPRPTTPAMGDGSCPRFWEQWGENCYYFGTTYEYPDYDRYDWATAIQKCKENAGSDFASGATLASINTAAENEYIKNTLLRIKDDDSIWDLNSAWIGLSKKDLGADYLWADGSPTDLMNWAPGEPNDEDGSENCVEMILPNFAGMWNDHDCAQDRYYVCKAPMGAPATTPTMPPVVPGNCPGAEWEAYGADCYLIRPDDYESWDTAHGVCVTETRDFVTRASIASVLTSAENYWLQARLIDKTQMPVRRAAWVGLYRFDADSEWRWFDGEDITYTNWAIGQPNDDLCVEMRTESGDEGYWADNDCSQLKGFVCKVPKDTGEAKDQRKEILHREVLEPIVRAEKRVETVNTSGQKPAHVNKPIPEGAQEEHTSPKDVKKEAEGVIFGVLVTLGVVGSLGMVAYFAVEKRRKRKIAANNTPPPTVEQVVEMS